MITNINERDYPSHPYGKYALVASGSRAKIRARLHASSEVAGTDESFFDDDRHNKAVTDLYHEKAGLLDGEDDSEVDLVSYACPQLGSNAEVLKLNECSGDLAIVDADEVS